MELALFIYIASLIGNLSFVVAVTVVGFMIPMCFNFFQFMEYNTKHSWDESKDFQTIGKEYLGKAKRCGIWILTIVFLTSFIPSEKTMYLMAAGYAGQSTYESDLGQKTMAVLEAKLDSYLVELTEGK